MQISNRLRFFSFALVLSASAAFSQDSEEISSLKALLKTDLSDSSKIIVMNQLTDLINEESVWMSFNRKVLNLANEKLKIARGKEQRFYLKFKAEATANLGYYYDDHGDKSTALDKYFEALSIYENSGYHRGKAPTLGNIGIILIDQKDYKEAKEYLEQALELKLKYEPENVAVNYINLGSVSDGLKDTVKSIYYYRKGLEAARKVEDKINIATALINISNKSYESKNFREGIALCLEANANYREAGDKSGESWSLSNISRNYLLLNILDSALAYGLEAEIIANQLGYPELMAHVAENLYNVYFKLEDWENAIRHYQVHNKMIDSLYNVNTQKDALKQKMEYEHNLEKTTLALKVKERQKRSQQAIYFTSGGLIMVVIFAFLIFRRLRITRRQKTIIEIQKLETEKQKRIIEEKNGEIVDSINYAKRLQDAILPGLDLVHSIFDASFVLYLPKDIVAGDFYWMHKTKNEVYIAAADCTGHGVPGAMVSVVCSNALDRAVKEFAIMTTGEILDKVTELVIQTFEKSGDEDVKDGMDISLCRINLVSRKIEFSGANNPLWIINSKAERFEAIRGDRQPVGKYDGIQPFVTHYIELHDGDWIYLFSDGYADQFGGPDGKKFMSGKLKTLLKTINHLGAESQKEELIKAFYNWKGELEQLDDICLIGIKIA